jgi:hypothetical protein
MRAGLSLVAVRSVNGKGMRTIFPFNLGLPLPYVFDCVDVWFFFEEILK